MIRIERLRMSAASNWFLLAAPALLAAAWLVSSSAFAKGKGAGLEAALLFDACVTLPLLYALCYRRKLPLWQLGLRMLAIASLGIYLLGWIVPAEAQVLLPDFAWTRTAGLALLVMIELRLLVAAVRLVFGSGANAEQVAAETGAPPWIARLMVLEARFWRAVWRLLRRR